MRQISRKIFSLEAYWLVFHPNPTKILTVWDIKSGQLYFLSCHGPYDLVAML